MYINVSEQQYEMIKNGLATVIAEAWRKETIDKYDKFLNEIDNCIIELDGIEIRKVGD